MEDILGTVLVIDDEAKYRRLIRANLAMAGYDVQEAADGHEALQVIYQREPDVVLLDLRLPDMDGFTLCQRIRKMSSVPVMVLTALDSEADTIQALDLGADDYLSKPFSPGEMLARIRALLRRSRDLLQAEPMGCGDIRLAKDTREVEGPTGRVRLTPIEWRLCLELTSHCGKVLTHEHLLSRVWGAEYLSEHEYLRVYIRRLRSYIEPDPHHPVYLVSHAGVGYALYPSPHGQ
ncbi:MAG: response regulator transcription factor [Firmicutes bacterium]|nr:response regulator transcription factor [Bacillota bacterium]